MRKVCLPLCALLFVLNASSQAEEKTLNGVVHFVPPSKATLAFKDGTATVSTKLARETTIEGKDGYTWSTAELVRGARVKVTFDDKTRVVSKIVLVDKEKPAPPPVQRGGLALGALKEGDQGYFIFQEFDQKVPSAYTLIVEELIDATRMVVRARISGAKPRDARILPQRFYLKGFPTKDKVDGTHFVIDEEAKVTGTIKHAGRTMFVIEPAPMKKP